MEINEEFKEKFQSQEFRHDQSSPAKPNHSLKTSQNSIPIYTVLTILQKMKNELGLEAMLEYLERYLYVIGQANPQLNMAVSKAVSLMSMEKMYGDACREKQM